MGARKKSHDDRRGFQGLNDYLNQMMVRITDEANAHANET